uniref:Uncharacterized protein n=1 Tax=Anguilla anguilla TaxID=7936 RepID=A0A0E9U6F1_ANGAN
MTASHSSGAVMSHVLLASLFSVPMMQLSEPAEVISKVNYTLSDLSRYHKPLIQPSEVCHCGLCFEDPVDS